MIRVGCSGNRCRDGSRYFAEWLAKTAEKNFGWERNPVPPTIFKKGGCSMVFRIDDGVVEGPGNEVGCTIEGIRRHALVKVPAS